MNTSFRSSRRVVVTGVGAVTPLGNDVSSTWKAITEGRSGVGPVTLFDASGCAARIAAEVRDFDPSKDIDPLEVGRPDKITRALHPKDKRKLGRFIHFALAAACEAYAQSKLGEVRGELPAERMGVNIGVGMGGLGEIEVSHAEFLKKGFRRITPYLIPQIIANMASGQVGILFNCRGPNLCNVTACSSSAHSLGESLRMIQRGDADVIISGGAEAVISPLGMGGFASMRALSTRNDAPEKASRPFDQGRDGFVMGEGAAVLILEEYEHAKKRNAPILGEIVGYGLSGDAYHMTLPSPEGEGGYRSMKMAMEDAGLSPSQIDYVNAHGTSTPAGDTEEAFATARLFGEAKKTVHVSSTKSMTGHLLGAAGAAETLFCLLAARDSIIPPTINLENLDPKCASLGMNFTPNEAVKKEVNYALTNSFGFGGTNATLIIKKV